MNTLDLLLKMDESKITRPTKEVEIKRLSQIAGQPVIFTIQAVTANKMDEIQENNIDLESGNIDLTNMKIFTILEGIKIPDLKNKDLQEKHKVPTPKDLIQKLLLAGERDSIYNQIQELSGYGKDSVIEIKNESKQMEN